MRASHLVYNGRFWLRRNLRRLLFCVERLDACDQSYGKPQSNSAFKKALDKLVNVYQSRSSSGMQWHGIEPLMQV